MLRLKLIRKTRRRGPSQKVLRIADGAFWVVLVFAASFGAGRLATGFPEFVDVCVSPFASVAEEGVPATSAVEIPLPPALLRGTPEIRPTIATEDVNAAD